MYYTKRLCICFTDFETKGDLEMRRIKDLAMQKQAFLRLNLERMLINEALKLRPEVRQNPHMINRIEKKIDIARVRRYKNEPLTDERVREVAI